ncbi:MAG: DUF4032 domain-containing protein [Candidatus Omnitrophota bacterium]|nr:DUF4032 domain-containing protein [Candidatus Omnitrophota bacterium]MDZ4241716.1 DUF4032 domain-containing protein [Candidatus Omnitrophota bacterium]
MFTSNAKQLLKDQRVVNEINRHKWFESEKLGYDIGFDKAAEDWIKRFSKDWLKNGDAKKNSKAKAKK